ncbi:MAG: iron ABC transporter permease [Lachnospiraceae bacterium]|nr:iron ABC transporter permease [Lachnospiraceae bacterium]
MNDLIKTNGKKSSSAFTRIFLIVFPIIVLIIGLAVGRIGIGIDEVIVSIGRLFSGQEASGMNDVVIRSMRLPRLLLAALAGAGLSVSGAIFQGLFSNPLATPDTLGVASGSGFGAVLAMLIGLNMTGIQLMAVIFGILAVVITALFGKAAPEGRINMVLAGIMVGSLFSALISLVKFTADTESQLPAITYWLLGGMDSAGISTLAIGAPPIIICLIFFFLIRYRTNLLPLQEDEARSMGVNIKRLRNVCIVGATMITASCVSMCGQVGWVGLIVPHFCRMLFGSNNVKLIPASISIGAGFMMIVDTLARTISPKEIPISVLTAIIGAPFFILMLKKKGSRFSG